jgi:lysozyme
MAQAMNPAVKRVAVGLLSLSATGFSAWATSEGFAPIAEIPTQGDVPTIGMGSTRYEDGSRVQLGDRISRPRAEQLARNLMSQDGERFAATMPGARLNQGEYDVYMNFVGQYGLANWANSSMRRDVLAGQYVKACGDLLRYKYAAGYDCSTTIHGRPNKRCYGVWTRQVARYHSCMEAQ